MSNDSSLKIGTPDLVNLDYEIVGIGSRFIGIAIDVMVIQCIVIVLILLAVVFISIFSGIDRLYDSYDFLSSFTNTVGKMMIAFIFLFYFVFNWGYHVYFETMKHGRTPGKRYAGTQVIKQDRSPITFRDSMIRNLLRIADSFPALYIAGGIFQMKSSIGQRLGDMAAGTIVIRNRGKSYLDDPKQQSVPGIIIDPSSYEHERAGKKPAISLTREEAELIMDFLRRSGNFSLEQSYNIAFNIASRIGQKYSVPQDIYEDDPEEFLKELIAGN